MAGVAERQSTYLSGFEAFRTDAAFGPAALASAREAAFARFVDRGFPTTRDEEWRFTSVTPIVATPFEPAAEAPVTDRAIEPFLFEGVEHRVVIVNGRFSPVLSTSLPAGVMVTDGAAVPSRSLHAFVDLNTAFFPSALTIAIAPKAVVVEPLHVLFIASGSAVPSLVSPRVLVTVGEGAQASIIEHYVGAGAGVTFSNVVADYEIGATAVVEHVKLQQEAPDAFHLASTFVRVDRGGTFSSQSITLGGRIVRNDIVSTLDGDGAECTLNGLYVAGGESLVDAHTVIDHAKPHCPSHEVYKGILTGRARAVFNGKIIVRQDAQKTNAKQTNKALLLTDDAQINSKPQLEIFADDVKCTHGAAIGQLDEDALFYLRARGISLVDARHMLIHAFALDVLQRITVPAVRAEAERAMVAQLSR